MQNKRDIEILISVLLIMSTVASIVALVHQPIQNSAGGIVYDVQLFIVNVLLGAGTMITAYVLRTAKLVPRIIPALGITGSIVVLVRGIILVFHLVEPQSLWGILLTIPFFGYNISLAIRMMLKGFDEKQSPPNVKQNLFQLSKNR